jgi:hypothetical protein
MIYRINGSVYTKESLIHICEKIDRAGVSGPPEHYQFVSQLHAFDLANILLQLLKGQEDEGK